MRVLTGAQQGADRIGLCGPWGVLLANWPGCRRRAGRRGYDRKQAIVGRRAETVCVMIAAVWGASEVHRKTGIRGSCRGDQSSRMARRQAGYVTAS